MVSGSRDANAGPGLSVVIPTTGTRPALLRRAVESCLAAAPGKGVEVLVVTNGSERAIDPGLGMAGNEVRSLHVAGRNANLARNAGMEEARGEYLRFLDDDDFLDPAGALAQYAAIEATNADISTGAVRFVDDSDREVGRYTPREPEDLASELFLQRPSTLPVAHLFRRAFLMGMQWNPTCEYLQDVEWMHAILRRSEVRWHAFPAIVGAWCQHAGARTSVDVAQRLGETALRMGASIIEGSIDALVAQGRLDGSRRQAAAKALWDYAHQGFQHSPVQWQRIAMRAREIDSRSRPGAAYFQRPPLRWLNPIAAEWLLFPLRATARRFAR